MSPDAPPAARRWPADATARALAVAGYELALCRLTDRPPDGWAWGGALAWAALSVGWLAFADTRPTRVARAMEWAWIFVHLAGLMLPYHTALALPWWQTGFAALILLYAGSFRVRAADARPLSPPAVVLTLALGAYASALPWAAHEWRLDPLWELRATVPLLLAAAVLGRHAWAVGALALWPAAAEPWTTSSAAPRGPDVVLITVDTLRLDAARTMRSFQGAIEAQAPAPWTLPSMASIHTGVEPGAHGAMQLEPQRFSAIAATVPTLAERFAAAGYDTAASVENAFVAPWRGFGRGFARMRYPDGRPALPRAMGGSHASPTGHQILATLGLLPAGASEGGVHEHLADLKAFLADRRPDRPLFVWLHLLDAHLPYRHALGAADLAWSDRLLALRANREQIGPDPSAATLDALRAAYDHEVAVLDDALTTALADLPPAPFGRVVVLTADHGEEFGEHDGWEHGHSLYQTLLSVPLVVARDGATAIAPRWGDAPERPASLLDVAPTVLALAGLPTDGLVGADLQQPPSAARPLRAGNPLYGDLDRTAVRVGPDKLIASPSADAADAVRRYDLRADPTEAHPGPDDPQRPLLPLLPSWHAGAEAPMDDATRRQLEALGYLTPR
jgi:arylsulfatase A-like enzyme